MWDQCYYWKFAILLLFLFLLTKTLLVNHMHVGSFPVTRVSLKKYANTYTDEKFKKTILISKATFNFILGHIQHDLQHDTVTEDRIPPAFRLAMCLYCLASGVAWIVIQLDSNSHKVTFPKFIHLVWHSISMTYIWITAVPESRPCGICSAAPHWEFFFRHHVVHSRSTTYELAFNLLFITVTI